jgi:hypothetical protein
MENVNNEEVTPVVEESVDAPEVVEPTEPQWEEPEPFVYVVPEEDAVITSPEPSENGATQHGSVAEGVIGSNAAERPSAPAAPVEDNKVYVYSDKNVSWDAAGKLSVGVNQITKKQHQLWSSKSYVRLATDEEIQGSGLI